MYVKQSRKWTEAVILTNFLRLLLQDCTFLKLLLYYVLGLAYAIHADRDEEYYKWSVAVHLFRLDESKCCCVLHDDSCYWMEDRVYPTENNQAALNSRPSLTSALRFVGLRPSSRCHATSFIRAFERMGADSLMRAAGYETAL
jgi:hypothetical protein